MTNKLADANLIELLHFIFTKNLVVEEASQVLEVFAQIKAERAAGIETYTGPLHRRWVKIIPGFIRFYQMQQVMEADAHYSILHRAMSDAEAAWLESDPGSPEFDMRYDDYTTAHAHLNEHVQAWGHPDMSVEDLVAELSSL